MINAHLRLGSRRSSTKLGGRKDNAYAADHLNIRHSGAQNIHAPTFPKSLPLQETETKSSASTPSVVNNQKTSIPLSVSSLAGENGLTEASIAVTGYEVVDGNIREYSTASGATMEVTTLEDPGEIETFNPKRWTSEQGAAAVVAAEQESHWGMLEWLLPACWVMMGGSWTSGVWLASGRTAWWAGLWFSFAIIFPNSKSEIEANVQMLDHVLCLLMMEVVSPQDTRTMWMYKVKIGQRHSHRTGQLTMRSIWNGTSISHMAEYFYLPEVNLKTLKAYIKTNLANECIQRSSSRMAAPILVAKKKDGALRLCVNYRALVKATPKNR